MSNDKQWLEEHLSVYKACEPNKALKGKIISRIGQSDKANRINFMMFFERRILASLCLALMLGFGTAIYSSDSSAIRHNLNNPFYSNTTILIAQALVDERGGK